MKLDTEKVLRDINNRFEQPLPEFYKRRIVFWYDASKEFEDKIHDLVLFKIKRVVLSQTNNFKIKKLLSFDDTSSNYLVYCPFARDESQNNWLLDIELYSETFSADLISIWIEEMGLQSSQGFIDVITQYRKFFNAKDRRDKIALQSRKITKPQILPFVIMATSCQLTDFKPNAIVRAVLSDSLNIQENSLYKKLSSYGATDAYWNMVQRWYGFIDEDKNLFSLAAHILLTATTRTMLKNKLSGLESYISIANQANCYDFVSEWIHSEHSEYFLQVAQTVENELCLHQRFLKCNLNDLLDSEYFPCINECIVSFVITDICNDNVNNDSIIQIVEKRRTCLWFDAVQDFYEGILQVANMQSFKNNHAAGFHTQNPQQVWKEYTTDYYKMDQYYRTFHVCFAKVLKNANANLIEMFKNVQKKVEGLYSTWFLGELDSNWSNICSDNLAQYGYIQDIPRQDNFYKDKIKTAKTKTFVIISDALRYEVAESLTKQLQLQTQCKIELNSCVGTFPTITPFGMAALLPHQELSLVLNNDKLAVLADGQFTGSNYREKILQKANPESVVLKTSDVIKMQRSDRKNKVKGKEVVYLYQDIIDKCGHDDEENVFGACDKTIEELITVVKIITNDFGGINVIITSDHGFLYTYDPLTEDDKLSKTSFNNQIVESGRRYAIVKKGAKPEYLQQVKLLSGQSDFELFTPRENIRLKMSGAGANFVHGGMSLQEMVVPVVEYHFLRNNSKEYLNNKKKYDTMPVSIQLVSSSRQIHNLVESFKFFQKEVVEGNFITATYNLYFTDAKGKIISDVQKIIANKTSKDEQERIIKCVFNLKSEKYSKTDLYYLVIKDETGLQAPQQIEFQIDIAMAIDDFSFFD